MNTNSPFPRSIRRDEEQKIKNVLAAVKSDGRSRVLLLIGDGGVGKTSLVRRMAETSEDPTIDWLDPIDVDDSQYWLLSNLEDKITDSLERPDPYFEQYRDALAQLSDYTHNNIGQETILSYVARVKDIFVRCYNEYAEIENKTVVIAFDTIETIRDTNLLSILTQWMKTLSKSTLFILSGRPVIREGELGSEDPIVTELKNPYSRLPVTEVGLSTFKYSHSDEYLNECSISDGLINQEKNKLIHLTRGQPLWLAFAVDYLTGNDIPEETEHTLAYLTQNIPYQRDMTPQGGQLYQSFLRRLLAPYRQSDFWHEAIKRLAVVRLPIDEPVWELLMADLALPAETPDLAQAWDELVTMPWIRPRSNGKYVTLHDAVAEAFAQRIFPLHDPDQGWRHKIWRLALDIYARLADQKEAELRPRLTVLNTQLSDAASAHGTDIIYKSLAVDAIKRERDEFRAARLYYLFLIDFAQGCDLLLHYFAQADQEQDLFFQDLVTLYLHRFLPGRTSSGAFDDVIKPKLDQFRRWLVHERPDYYVAIGVVIATYFVGGGRWEAALELLNQLPTQIAPEFQYRINILSGNACLRIPSRVAEGRRYFDKALEVAAELDPADGSKLLAEAHKECGFYYRNIGDWGAADRAYRKAQDTLVNAAVDTSLPTDLGEIASIETNWAYVKGLAGNHNGAIQLADRAVRLRRQYGSPVEVAISLSVCGEVYRYAKRYPQAWEAYASAESLLGERLNLDWLGLIYQEQAICLYQAMQDNVNLVDDPMAEAKRLITHALEICFSHSIRSYPSALNRAARIFGHDDPDQGLKYLEDGIEQARRLSDGWFLLANLVEYAELSYYAWVRTGNDRYRAQIIDQAPTISEALSPDEPAYRFPDLSGRWEILQGHLALREYLYNDSVDALRKALEHYQSGFPAIAERSLASSGATLIPAQFDNFERLFRDLPPEVRADWQTKLMEAWRGPDEGSTVLLARLQELLARLEREER